MTTSQITKLTLIAAASFFLIVVTFAVPPAVKADPNYQKFASPSGNIRCILDGRDKPTPIAMCQISDKTYPVPPGTATDQAGGQCPPGSDLGRDFRLDQGKPGYVTCTYSAIGSGFGPWPTLDYGQTNALGAIACVSKPEGMTCTDNSSGHFFQVSRDSYQVG